MYVPITDCGCWIWLGTTAGGGYGVFTDGQRRIKAHRLSFELHVGPIPQGLFVCHRCDVPPCVNPAHLFLGTCADNCEDMRLKGRSQRGIRNGHVKLTELEVLRIREALKAGLSSVTSLGQQYGVSQSAISLIKARKTWVHV
jgi:hypothetical protein